MDVNRGAAISNLLREECLSKYELFSCRLIALSLPGQYCSDCDEATIYVAVCVLRSTL